MRILVRALNIVLVRPFPDPDAGGDGSHLLDTEHRKRNHPEPPCTHGPKVETEDGPLHGALGLDLVHRILLLVLLGRVVIGLDRRSAPDVVHGSGGAALLANAKGHTRRHTRRVGGHGLGLLDVLAQLTGRDDLDGGSLRGYATVVKNDDKVGGRSAHLDVVGDQQAGPALHERAPDAVMEDPLGGVRVDGAEAIVEEDVLRVGVESTGQRDTLLLASRQRDALLTDKGLVSLVEDLEVALESAGDNHFLVPLLVEGRREQDVVLDVGIDQPRRLSGIGHGVGKASLGVRSHLLTAPAAGTEHTALHQRHLAEKSHEDRGLSDP